jgi:trigger factor
VNYEVQHEGHIHKHHLDIAVTAIQKVELPELDQELVSKITGGKVASPEDFRNNLRKELEAYWATQADARVDDALANEVVRRHDFVPPESMVEAFLQSFLDDVKGRSRERKLPPNFDVNKFREENRAYAVWQSKWMLLREAIAEKENLSVTDDDIAALAEREAARLGLEKERMLEYYRRSGSATDRLLSEKVMGFLRSSAKISETVVDERAV